MDYSLVCMVLVWFVLDIVAVVVVGMLVVVVVEQMMLFVEHSLDLYNVVGIDNNIDYQMGYHNRHCNMDLVDMGFVV